MIELWIVRHGQTDWNASGRIQGWTNVPLNTTGVWQAEQLSLWLEGVPFQSIVTSDLERASRTASILQARIGCPLVANSRLRERGFGEAEGLVRTEARRRYPSGFPNAETDAEVQTRAEKLLFSMTQQFRTGRILCVSHGGFIRTLLQLAGAKDVPPLHNTSLCILRYNGHRWGIGAANWAEHLSVADAKTSP